ncbi:MAG: YIP1 family protein [archaeon]|nr:YIP1 family protein [archaeon]
MGYFKTWLDVVFDPMEFLEKLPKKVGYREPAIFALKTYGFGLAVLLVIGLFFSVIFSTMFASLGLSKLAGIGFGGIFLMIILGIPLMLAFAFIGLFIGSGLIHLFVTLLGGKGSYKETFRLYSYSIAPSLIWFIPMINAIVGIYSLILVIMGVYVRHKLSVGRSVLAVLLPTILFFFIVMFTASLYMTLGGLI